jgi:hypothetical protein
MVQQTLQILDKNQIVLDISSLSKRDRFGHQVPSFGSISTSLNKIVVQVESISTLFSIIWDLLLGFILATDKIPPRIIRFKKSERKNTLGTRIISLNA